MEQTRKEIGFLMNLDFKDRETVQQIINDTRELVNDKFIFKLGIDKLEDSINSDCLTGLIKWFAFFNENYFKSPCIYSGSVYALLKAADKSELFRTQTDAEFQISCGFYEKIINVPFFLRIDSTEDALQLLNISLLLGKYPGMQIRSVFKAIEMLKHGVDSEKINRIFEHIFIKYENPKFLTNNLTDLNLNEIDILMFMLQGNNICRHPEIPVPLSKKESYILLNKIPGSLTFTDNILKRLIVSSKFILATNNSDLLNRFYTECKTFKYRINTFIQDIKYWTEVYQFLTKNRKEIYNISSILDIIDYCEYMKYRVDENYSLKGRTVFSIQRAIDTMHSDAMFNKQQELLKLCWKERKIEHPRVFHEGENYLFKELTSGKELYEESDEMHHCAYTYIEHCANNFCSLWSLQKEVNTTYSHYLTLEIQGRDIAQVSGKHNRKPSKKDLKLIEKWSTINGFTMGRFLLSFNSN